MGFTAGVIWRMRAAPPGRDEERPLLDAAEGSRAGPNRGEMPRPAQRTRVLLQCAAVTLFGGMAAGLVGLVRGLPMLRTLLSLPECLYYRYWQSRCLIRYRTALLSPSLPLVLGTRLDSLKRGAV
jgi:hypothetical protein